MRAFYSLLALLACCAFAVPARADTTVTVDPAKNWLGWMNVFELPENGGGFVFPSGWGTADLSAVFTGETLELKPNTSIARDVPPSDAFWWKPDGTGNKNMEANFYVEETGLLSGQTVSFAFDVVENTLTAPYQAWAFIKDFAPDYSSNTTLLMSLTGGPQTIALATEPGAGRHVQYGFMMLGPNAQLNNAFGSIRITGTAPIPEPATLSLLGLGALGLLARRRK